MPPRKQIKGTGLFSSCGINGCNRRNVSEPSSQFHVLCMPNFFGNIPLDGFEDLLPKKDFINGHRVAFLYKYINAGETEIDKNKLYIIQRDKGELFDKKPYEDDTELKNKEVFLQWIQVMITRLQMFEQKLKEKETQKNLKGPLIHSIEITFNVSEESYLNTMNGTLGSWHTDKKSTHDDASRQFSILVTQHPQTEFSIHPDETQIRTQIVKPQNIRQCPSKTPGSASYFENNIIHRKPNISSDYNSRRFIISIIFKFNVYKDIELTINPIKNYQLTDLNGNTIRRVSKFYNSPEHMKLEVEALKEIFGNITLPQKISIVGGKRCSSNKKFK